MSHLEEGLPIAEPALSDTDEHLRQLGITWDQEGLAVIDHRFTKQAPVKVETATLGKSGTEAVQDSSDEHVELIRRVLDQEGW